MTDLPTGDHDDEERPDEPRPGSPEEQIRELMRQLGLGGNPADLDVGTLMARLQQMFASMGTPGADASAINWAQAKHAARQHVAIQGSDPTPSSADARAVADAVRLGELWLDDVTEFAQVTAPPAAWSRAEWIEATMQSWQVVVEPIVASLADAMVGVFQPDDEQAAGIPGLGALGGMLTPMLRGAAGALYASQLVEAIASLATKVLTGTEIGLQVLASPKVVLLTHNIQEFGEGLSVSSEDLLLHLSVREAARQRLFAAVPWLAPQVIALFEHYAREITIDASALSDVLPMGELDELTPEKIEEASKQLQGRLFSPSKTPEQVGILERLETLLALIEGWVDLVTSRATSAWMTSEQSLAEAVRRRRAIGGPAEQLFAKLVGLEIRPRRIRDAANLWAALEDARGSVERDAVWHHPDLMPTGSDLDDPLGFVSGERGGEPDEMDVELAKLLGETDDPDQSEA